MYTCYLCQQTCDEKGAHHCPGPGLMRSYEMTFDNPFGKCVTDPVTIDLARLPTNAAARKALPIVAGALDYFPDALLAVAELSMKGNEQHNPGEPLHWARGKSTDEADALVRHLMERGTVDVDGIRHSTKIAWRALALLQKELETANNLPISRGSKCA